MKEKPLPIVAPDAGAAAYAKLILAMRDKVERMQSRIDVLEKQVSILEQWP